MKPLLPRPGYHCRAGAFVALALGIMASAGCHMAANGKNTAGTRAYSSGNYQLAIQEFQQALTSDPRNADAYYNLAATYHQLGKTNQNSTFLQQSEVLYNQCLDLSPDHADCHRGLAVLLVETNRADRAFALMRNWAVTSPYVADARIELARLYEEFGDKTTARRHLEESLALNQNAHRAWAALGRLREDAGESTQALENYRRALATNPAQPAVVARVAALEQKLGIYSMPSSPVYAAPPGVPAAAPAGPTRLAQPPVFPLR